MKIRQGNTKAKDVVISFFCPPVLCGNSSPFFREGGKRAVFWDIVVLIVLFLVKTEYLQKRSNLRKPIDFF